MRLKEFLIRLFVKDDFIDDNFIDSKSLQVHPKVNRYTLEPYYPRYILMAILYKDGFTIEEIATMYDCTRERVRQCLAKVQRRG